MSQLAIQGAKHVYLLPPPVDVERRRAEFQAGRVAFREEVTARFEALSPGHRGLYEAALAEARAALARALKKEP